MSHNSSVNSLEFEQLLKKYKKCDAKVDEAAEFGKPLLWIGIYIATTSLFCFLSMAADTIRGFWQKQLWFPCKIFTINAASLTMLSVAMKLPLDLNTPMPTEVDQLVKLSNMAFMCIVMANFMPSLGTMDDGEILTNCIALGIPVITAIVNIAIQLHTGVIFYPVKTEYILVLIFMFSLFVLLSCSALTVSTTKSYLELKYKEVHKMTLNESEELKEIRGFTKLETDIKKYWMMAATASPQFVMARSVTCSAAGVVCFLTAFVLVEAEVRIWISTGTAAWLESKGKSDYKFSSCAILVIDSIAVVICTTAPALRWFTAVSSTFSGEGGGYHFREEFKIEKYWIKKLVEWKESPIAVRIHYGRNRRKFIHVVKYFTLNLCIGLQVLVILLCKFTRLIISILFVNPVFMFCHFFNKLKKKYKSNTDDDTKELDLNRYVLRLEGEKEFPSMIIKNIFEAVTRLIQMGRNDQPKSLMNLMSKSIDFKGVAQFESDEIEHLFPEEPSNCWSLPIVTLTSIAISLPKIGDEFVEHLLRGVDEGLLYIRLIEKSLNTKQDLAKIRKSADAVWLQLELYSMWLDLIDLRKFSKNGKTSEENLQKLGEISKKSVLRFKKKMNRSLEENPREWPIRVIAANSMYRISQTVLMNVNGGHKNENEMFLFEKLSVMIADILGACFTNLPRLVSLYCHCNQMEKREESVKLAARILGETEEILKIVHSREHPIWDPDQCASIDEWRTFMKQENQADLDSSSISERNSFYSSDLHIDIE